MSTAVPASERKIIAAARRGLLRQHPRLHDGDAARARLRRGRSASPPRTSGSSAAATPRRRRSPASSARSSSIASTGAARWRWRCWAWCSARPPAASPTGLDVAGRGAGARRAVRRPGDVASAVHPRRRRPARAARPGHGRGDGRVLRGLGARRARRAGAGRASAAGACRSSRWRRWAWCSSSPPSPSCRPCAVTSPAPAAPAGRPAAAAPPPPAAGALTAGPRRAAVLWRRRCACSPAASP